ncbi:MAG: dipeptide epimerase [Rhizobiales bacterium]|nr:dipeptide epimerase [Hyphomicrobiales bacterium]
MIQSLTVAAETWPIAGSFTIARGAKTEAAVVVARIGDGAASGRGEAVPYPRYGESVPEILHAIEAMAGAVAAGLDREGLRAAMPPGAARNAIDCALWDLAARRTGRSVAELAGLPAPRPVETAYTISLATPDSMAEAARHAAHRPLLKVKLGGAGDPARIAAVRRAAPRSRLIVDANEAWSADTFAGNMAAAAAAGVELIEQPLPADQDGALADLARPVPVCADESVHVTADLPRLRGLYDAVNIKLDKTGGLTEAIALDAAAKAAGFKVMIGCMVATSLSMAPALLLAGNADFVDLDGPLLLARDREPGLVYDGSRVMPAAPGLWG